MKMKMKISRKRIYSTQAAGPGETEERHTYPVEDKIPMAEFQTAKRHGHPAFDVCGEKDKRTLLDDHLEIGIEELKDEVQICL
jgi:hypothetical protein